MAGLTEEATYFAEAIHSSMVTDAYDVFSIRWGLAIWVVDNDVRYLSLNHMDRHIVCLGQCHDLWFPSPHGSIPDFGTVLKKLFWCHQPTLCRPCHVLAF